MEAVNILFPHQLLECNPLLENGAPFYLMEEYLFFKQYAFHKQKIAFHRAGMQFYRQYLISKGAKVHYIETNDPLSDIRKLIPNLASRLVKTIRYIDPTDDWLHKRIRKGAARTKMECVRYENPLFLNRREDLRAFFNPDKKKFFQTRFYIDQRKKRQILVDETDNPLGGKWSYDAENRKKYPRKKEAPKIAYPKTNSYYEEAKTYVQKYFPNNPGELTPTPLYPTDYAASRKWLQNFLQDRFAEFGAYEDAIVASENILHHSVLTPMLNVGLITPQEVIDEALQYAQTAQIPLNSKEGFVRQIIGWREFIRGVYECKGAEERTRNYWGFKRKIPASFYHGTTGITPIDVTIKKVLQTAYCHHIERLMVLGNFMLLCEFDPDEVYRWFMELFIDAYDWVMVPNVYGMSQFADGGIMATKPYISGSNYLKKMSDYGKGSWQEIWDALFWRFMHVHREFFLKNPRLSMLLRNFDKRPAEKRNDLIQKAEDYLASLDS